MIAILSIMLSMSPCQSLAVDWTAFSDVLIERAHWNELSFPQDLWTDTERFSVSNRGLEDAMSRFLAAFAARDRHVSAHLALEIALKLKSMRC